MNYTFTLLLKTKLIDSLFLTDCSRTRTTDRRKLTASQLTDMQTDREKQLRVLYRSENALRAVNNLTRLENRFTAGSRFGQG